MYFSFLFNVLLNDQKHENGNFYSIKSFLISLHEMPLRTFPHFTENVNFNNNFIKNHHRRMNFTSE